MYIQHVFSVETFADVPEGSFIIREHSPMSNLFSCLWFNEVDRFTSRDQLSFAYTYTKFVRTNPGKRFYLNMFKVNFSSLLLWQLFKLGNFTRMCRPCWLFTGIPLSFQKLSKYSLTSWAVY